MSGEPAVCATEQTAGHAVCRACAAAQLDVETGMYRAGCQECAARALAHGPQHHEAMLAAAFTPAYRAALRVVFGDGWMDGHLRVRAWSKRIEAARAARLRGQA